MYTSMIKLFRNTSTVKTNSFVYNFGTKYVLLINQLNFIKIY